MTHSRRPAFADAEAIAEARQIINEIGRHHLALGVRRALSTAAEILAISVRRTRGVYHGEARTLPELARIRECYAAYLCLHRADLARETAAVDAYLFNRRVA